MHLGDLAFRRSDLGDGADGVGRGCVLRRAVLHADQLLLFGRDLHIRLLLARSYFPASPVVDRDQFHVAIGRDAALVGLVPGMHRIDPVEDFSSGASGGRGACAPAVDYGAAEEGAGNGKNHDERFEFVHGQIPSAEFLEARHGQLQPHDFFVVHQLVIDGGHEVGEEREEIERSGAVCDERGFQRQLALRDHGLVVERDELARGDGGGVLLLDSRFERAADGVGAGFGFELGGLSLADGEILLLLVPGGELDVDAELPHRGHAALIEVAAGEGVVRELVFDGEIGFEAGAVDHAALAGEDGGVGLSGGEKLVEGDGDLSGGHLVRDLDVAAGWAVEEGEDGRLFRDSLLLEAHGLGFEDGVLRLGFEDVLLRGVAGSVARLGNAQDVGEDGLVFADVLGGDDGVVQLVVRLLEAGDDTKADGFVLPELGVSVGVGDGGAEFALAGEWHFLRDGDAEIAGGLASDAGEGPGSAVGGIAEGDGGVRERSGLGGTEAGGCGPLFGGDDLGIVS